MRFKLIFILIIFLLFSCCKTIKQNTSKSKIYFKINSEKTYVDNIGGIMLSFDVVNDSNEDIIMLKPNNTFNSRFDFFTNTMECEDIPIWEDNSEFKHLEVTDKDYLTIKSKTSSELLMNGRNYNWLACDSDSVKIKIKYEPFKTIEEGDEYLNEKKQIVETVSKVNIYSDNTKFKLHK
ncbi:hypothetical protein [Aureibaculum luteum]|uniref:hypothetical protein n=1 Tax=Aureibaculum luteum TaxID=1548456 RepID=UPI000E46C052|nr:hypothetical protein [Aureibaculum luteum]